MNGHSALIFLSKQRTHQSPQGRGRGEQTFAACESCFSTTPHRQGHTTDAHFITLKQLTEGDVSAVFAEGTKILQKIPSLLSKALVKTASETD